MTICIGVKFFKLYYLVILISYKLRRFSYLSFIDIKVRLQIERIFFEMRSCRYQVLTSRKCSSLAATISIILVGFLCVTACLLPVDVRRSRAIDDVTSVHAFAQESKSEWLIIETMMRNSMKTGRRRETLFDATRETLFRIAITTSGSFAIDYRCV